MQTFNPCNSAAVELSFPQKHQSLLTQTFQRMKMLFSRRMNLTVPQPELVWSSGPTKQNHGPAVVPAAIQSWICFQQKLLNVTEFK